MGTVSKVPSYNSEIMVRTKSITNRQRRLKSTNQRSIFNKSDIAAKPTGTVPTEILIQRAAKNIAVFWFFCLEISTHFRTCMDERRPHENSSQSFLTFSLDAIHTCPHQNPKNYFCQGLSTSKSHRLHGGSFMVRCAAPQFLLRQWIPPMMWDKRSDRSSHLNISPFSASAP